MSTRLAAIVDTVDAKLKAHDAESEPFPGASGAYWEWRARQAALSVALLTELADAVGLKASYRAPDVHTITIARIRSGSTSGWDGALRNWQAAARKRLRAEA